MKKYLLCLLLLLTVRGFAQEVYETNEGLEVQQIDDAWYIVGYKGSDPVLTIPEYWEGNMISGILDNAFAYNSIITDVIVSNNIGTIGSYVFANCKNLRSVYIGNGVYFIDHFLFGGSNNLTSIVVDPLNSTYDSRDNCNAIVETYSNTLLETCKSTVIPSSVTKIGYYAYNLAEFTEFVIPDNITKIEGGAFNHCKNLTSITIPNSVTTIDGHAFYQCSSLSSIIIPESITTIGDNAFEGCSSLTTFTVPKSVTSLGAGAIPSTVSSITVEVGNPKYDSRNNCNAVIETAINKLVAGCSSTIIPNDVTSIGNYAFSSCSSLSSIIIPENVTSIGNYAFYSCSSLSSIIIPESVTSIGNYAFSSCSSLSSIIIPESVTSIGNYAFSSCKLLKTISIPASVTQFGSNIFSGDIAYINNVNPISVNSNTFKENCIIVVPSSAYENYCSNESWQPYVNRNQVLPNDGYVEMDITVTADDNMSALHRTIGDSNLQNVVSLKISGTINSYDLMILRNKMVRLRNLDLTDVDIVANSYQYYTGYSSKNNELGPYVFERSNLRSIKLPKSLISIGERAFYYSLDLAEVVFNEGLTSIGRKAFEHCGRSTFGLGKIVLPSTLVTCGADVFYESGLEVLDMSACKNMKALSSDMCAGCNSLKTVLLPESLERVDCGAFYACGNFHSIVLPPNVKSIDSEAFYASGLSEISMPATLEKIGNYAFRQCRNLYEIKIPSGVTSIANNAFYSCDNLNDVYTYTVEPTSINQQTFATYRTATLHVPTQSYYNYFYDTQWSQFLKLVEFNEPYEYFYINNDYTLENATGAIDGAPDADINEGSGLITKDDVNQELGDVHVKQDADTNEGGSIIAEGESTITGNKIYHDIKVSGGKWYFFSFPFNVKISDIICEGQYIFREYDGAERAQNGTGNSWKKLPADQEYLVAGKGYIFHTSKAGVLSLPEENAEISAEDKVLALQVHASANSANASWNFIGNPNTSYYDMDDMKFGAPITVWDSKTQSYVAYRPGDDNYQLAPYEAFFVQTSESAKNVEFDAENQQTHKEAKKNKENKAKAKAFQPANPTRSLINLTITGANGTDKTRVVFNDDKALAYEAECDAAKFLSDASVPQLYSHDGQGVKYAINERPNADGTVMLGFISTNGGDYTIEATRSDIPVLLKDNETGAVVNISDKAYSFTAKSGTFDNRFLLVQDYDATGIEDITAKTGVEINVTNGAIEFGNVGDNKIKVFDIAGSLVVKAATDKATVAPGIYVVKVGNYATKVSVK